MITLFLATPVKSRRSAPDNQMAAVKAAVVSCESSQRGKDEHQKLETSFPTMRVGGYRNCISTCPDLASICRQNQSMRPIRRESGSALNDTY